jgi:hypothetical protein
MNACRNLAVCVALVLFPSALAHRLDEYLQATRLAIDVARVDVEMDLTPGASMAREVMAWIDTDRDGEISAAEGQAYARQVLGSVVLKVDGRPAVVELVEATAPSFPEMLEGLGMLRLRATAKLQTASSGHHQVSFLNTHRPERSVYLVNALAPQNPRVRIDGQRRDRAQLGITLDYSVAGEPTGALAVLAGVAMAAGLCLRLLPARKKV